MFRKVSASPSTQASLLQPFQQSSWTLRRTLPGPALRLPAPPPMIPPQSPAQGLHLLALSHTPSMLTEVVRVWARLRLLQWQTVLFRTQVRPLHWVLGLTVTRPTTAVILIILLWTVSARHLVWPKLSRL